MVIWYVPSYQSFFYDVTEYQKYFNIDRINRYRQGSPRMLLQKKHPDIDPRVLILEPIEVCSLLNRKKLNAQEIMGRTHGIARGVRRKGRFPFSNREYIDKFHS